MEKTARGVCDMPSQSHNVTRKWVHNMRQDILLGDITRRTPIGGGTVVRFVQP